MLLSVRVPHTIIQGLYRKTMEDNSSINIINSLIINNIKVVEIMVDITIITIEVTLAIKHIMIKKNLLVMRVSFITSNSSMIGATIIGLNNNSMRILTTQGTPRTTSSIKSKTTKGTQTITNITNKVVVGVATITSEQIC